MAQLVGVVANGVKGSKAIGDGLYCAFLANLDAPLRLDTGKTIDKHKSGWKAKDAEKEAAKVTFSALTDTEKAEVRAYLQPAIDEFLSKKAAFREFTAGKSTMGRGGRGVYR